MEEKDTYQINKNCSMWKCCTRAGQGLESVQGKWGGACDPSAGGEVRAELLPLPEGLQAWPFLAERDACDPTVRLSVPAPQLGV